MEMDDFLCFYLQSYIILPAAVLVSLLGAYDCFTCLLLARNKTHSRGGVYWLCSSRNLSYFDLFTESNLHEATERHIIERRCVWYQVHIAHSDVDSLMNHHKTSWSQITKTIHAGNAKSPALELNQLLWRIIRCCLIRLQETPQFLQEDDPQPRCVLYAFLLHSTPLLLNLEFNSKVSLCARLESLLLFLGVIQVHHSECYSVRRLLRHHGPPHETDDSELPSWRFNFWMLLRKKYCLQMDPMLFPRLALHLGIHSSVSLQLLSENEVVVSYITRSESLVEASRRFMKDLSAASDGCDAGEHAMCCLHIFDKALLDSVPQPMCDEISKICHDDTDKDNGDAVHSNKQFSHNLDFIEAQLHITSSYVNRRAHEQGLQRLESICERLDWNLSNLLKDISHSVRYLALVAWARGADKKRTSEEKKESHQPDSAKMIGEQLFSIHLELKRSPTKQTLLVTSARLAAALSDWKKEFTECSIPPCWTKCQKEIVCLIQVSRIGFQALDSISTHFFADDVNTQQQADFARILSTFSNHISDCH